MAELNLTSVIIEDNPLEMDLLKELLSDFHEIQNLGTAQKVDTGVNIISKYKPDIVFLDIQLGDKEGFEIVKRIKEYNFEPLVIYTTSRPDFAIEAIQYSAFDFLPKPINSIKLSNTIKRAKERIIADIATKENNKNIFRNKISILGTSRTYLVDIKDIVLLETFKGKGMTRLKLIDKTEIISTKGIGEFDKELLAKKFEKISRSLTFNPRYIKSYTKEGLIDLEGDCNIKISKRLMRDLLKKLNLQ